MAGDWIKYHRKTVHSDVAENDMLLGTWMRLLGAANWKDSTFRGAAIKRGQLVFSWRELPERLYPREGQAKPAINTLRTRFSLFQHLEMIKVDVLKPEFGNKMSVVTICNWELYQDVDTSVDTSTDTSTDTSVDTSTDTDRRSNKKGKNVKKVPPLADLPEILQNERFHETLSDWIAVKPAYKPAGLKSLIYQAANRAEEFGLPAVCEVMQLAMSNQWAGWNKPDYFAGYERKQSQRLPTNEEIAAEWGK